MSKQAGNPIDARELSLYATNHFGLYVSRIYSPVLALKLWRYVADDAANLYAKEFGPCAFSPATRDLAAAEIAEHYQDAIEEAA